MLEYMTDQAEGLRRLLGRDFVRILTFASAGRRAGKTSAVQNLAVALARAGKNVMIFDENGGPGNVAHRFGLKSRLDLLDVIKAHKSLEEAMLQGPDGISIMQAAKGVEALSGLNFSEQDRLGELFSNLARPVDVVLVDTKAGSPGHLLSLSLSSQEILVVVSTENHSITDAYALIKMMNRDYAKRHFRIVVNRAKSAAEARAVFDNMAKVARRYLAISLDFMGHIPDDEALAHSFRLEQSVVEAYPLAESSASFRQIADSITRLPCPRHDEISFGDFLQRLIQGSRYSEANIRA